MFGRGWKGFQGGLDRSGITDEHFKNSQFGQSLLFVSSSLWVNNFKYSPPTRNEKHLKILSAFPVASQKPEQCRHGAFKGPPQADNTYRVFGGALNGPGISGKMPTRFSNRLGACRRSI